MSLLLVRHAIALFVVCRNPVPASAFSQRPPDVGVSVSLIRPGGALCRFRVRRATIALAYWNLARRYSRLEAIAIEEPG